MKKLNLKFVSDIIGDDYKNWKPKDNVIIKAQTGTGKNYFTFNVLLENLGITEEMLYLCNRRTLKIQTKIDLYKKQKLEVPKKSDGKIDFEKIEKTSKIGKVTIRSYQGVADEVHERGYENHFKPDWYEYSELDLSRFKYCIFDEIHYIFSDSFTGKTDLVYKKIMSDEDKTIKVFISATIDELEKPIYGLSKKYGLKPFVYEQEVDYSYVKPHVFKELKDIAQMIKNDKSNEKWLVFIYAKKQASIFTEYLDSSEITFVHADTKDKLNDIAKESAFDTKVLISTSVLDNGVNIKDRDLRHIVIMDGHKTRFIQQLGRIRFWEKDGDIYAQEVNLYMPYLYRNNFEKMLQTCKKHNDMLTCYYLDEDSFFKKYDRSDEILPKYLFYNYNGKAYIVNEIGHRALDYKLEYYKAIIDEFDNENLRYDYKKRIMLEKRLGWLNLSSSTCTEINHISDEEEVKNLKSYIDSILGKKLFTEDVQKISDMIIKELITVGEKIDYRSKVLKHTTIERILRDDLGLNYALKSGRYQNKRYITISKI